MTLIKILILISIANFSPILARNAFNHRWRQPVDFGRHYKDGRRLFGDSKTIRGVLAAVLGAALVGTLLGFALWFSLLIGLLAMLGDLCSSFFKRRRGIACSDQALGVDQLPEAVFPLMFAFFFGMIGFFQVIVGALVFFLFALWVSPLLYRLGIRARPY